MIQALFFLLPTKPQSRANSRIKPQIHRIKTKHPNKRKKEEGKGQRLVTRRHFLKSFCLRLPEREEGWGLDLSLRVMGSPWADRFISASFWRRCFCTTLNFAMAKPLPLLSYRTLEGRRRRKALVVPSLVFPIVGGIFGCTPCFIWTRSEIIIGLLIYHQIPNYHPPTRVIGLKGPKEFAPHLSKAESK